MSAVSLIYRPNRKAMVVATPSVEASPIDQWFHAQTEALNLLAPLPPLPVTQQVLEQHLPGRVQRLSRNVPDSQDPASWLAIILKASALIRLWPTPERSELIALNCSSNLKLAREQLGLIQSEEFRAARTALGISKHWFVVIRNFPLQVPKHSELLDVLYAQLAQEDECGIVLLERSIDPQPPAALSVPA